MDTLSESNYACFKCKEPLEMDSIQSHACFQVEVVADNMLGDETQIEYFEEGAEGAYTRVEFLEASEGPYAKVEYFDGGEGKIQYLQADDETNMQLQSAEEPAEQPLEDKVKIKVTSNGRRGDWSPADIHRLLDAYINNCKVLPLQNGLHNHYLWDRVMRDLKPYGNFSRFLVQAKIKKLKKAGKAILESGNESSKWPYLQQVIELIQVEEDREARASQGSNVQYVSEEEELDSGANNTAVEDGGESDVVGLRRFTIKETRHLIEVYKKHLPKYFEGTEPRKIAWDDIIADLGYGLAEKYTMYQIRAKIRNAQNTYRSIVEKKRKKPRTHWPLFADLAALAKCERELAELYQVPIAIYRWGGKHDPDIGIDGLCAQYTGDVGPSGETNVTKGQPRWNDEETKELLLSFRKHMAELASCSKAEKKTMWNVIAAEVNTIRRRKVNHVAVRSKIDSLRAAWEKSEMTSETRELGPLHSDIKSTFEIERDFQLFNGSEDEEDPEPITKKAKIVHSPKFLLDDGERAQKKKKSSQDALPSWFVQFNRDAEKRHQEKMMVQEKLLTTIERLLSRYE